MSTTLSNLVVNHGDVPMTNSLKVSKVFGKEHFHVMEAIRGLDCPTSFIESNFRLYEYEQKVGFGIRKNPMYLMTRDGFTFLAMGFTGARAAEFKERYIAEFNRIERDVSNFGQTSDAVRITDQNGEPWFIAKDICEILGLSNAASTLALLDHDEKDSIHIMDGTPGNPNKTIINESGLYSLILRSRKPEAKAFKKWVILSAQL